MKASARLFHRTGAMALAVMISWGTVAWAEKKPLPYPAFKTANGFSRFAQSISGFTPLSGWMANRILRRELGKYISGNLKARLTLYSGSDLLGGKARRIEMSGLDVLLDKFIPLSEFHFQSVEDSPIFISKGSRPILLKEMRFQVNARMSEADINRMLTSEKGRDILTDLKINIPPFGKQHLDVVNPAVSLEGERITIQSVMNKHDRPIEFGLPVKVSGKLTARRSRLNLSDLDLRIEGFENTEEIEQLVETYFSEIVNLNHIKVDRHKVKIAIEKSEIKDRQLYLEATVKVEPKREALEKYLSRHDKKAKPQEN